MKKYWDIVVSNILFVFNQLHELNLAKHLIQFWFLFINGIEENEIKLLNQQKPKNTESISLYYYLLIGLKYCSKINLNDLTYYNKKV